MKKVFLIKNLEEFDEFLSFVNPYIEIGQYNEVLLDWSRIILCIGSIYVYMEGDTLKTIGVNLEDGYELEADFKVYMRRKKLEILEQYGKD